MFPQVIQDGCPPQNKLVIRVFVFGDIRWSTNDKTLDAGWKTKQRSLYNFCFLFDFSKLYELTLNVWPEL